MMSPADKISVKKSPQPLRQMPEAKLDFSRPEAPVSTAFDDIYFSVDNGLAETQDVFLKACGLPERFGGRTEFTIAELGFGSGLNFLAAWQLWKAHRPSPAAQLTFISVEGFPLSTDQLQSALSQWTQLRAEADALIAAWPGRTPGQHVLHFTDGVTLILCHDAVLPALDGLNCAANCWFLDGFSPAKNPDMWSEAVLQRVHDLCAPDCHVGTFTVAGSVRRGLIAAGFDVSKQPGFGRKRERLQAIKPGQLSPHSPSTHAPIIIGSGIAGASIARSFLLRGIAAIIISAGDARSASANPAAIVKPRLDLQDRAQSRFFLSAYLYAQAAYDGDGVLMRGVAHCAKTQAEEARFEKLGVQHALPIEHLTYLTAERLTKKTGLTHKFGGLWFDCAPIIDPTLIRERFMHGAKRIDASAARIERSGALWHVYDEGEALLAKSDQLILTAGAQAAKLYPALTDHIRYQGGQVTWGKAGAGILKAPLTYGGYGLPLGDDVLLGATHYRLAGRDPYAASEMDDQKNIEGFIAAGGFTVSADHARASVRVTTANTLPRLVTPEPGLTIMTGLGGRGFVYAPLLGEQAVRRASQAADVLTRDAAQIFGAM